MAKKPEKPKHETKHEEPEHEKQDARPERPERQRTQVVGQTGTARTAPIARAPEAIAKPIPRPQFRPQPHYSPPRDDTMRVINSLQQTVRSQAILIVQYQNLLKLDAMEAESEGEEGDEAGEAA